jgi:hypothetical protein
LALSIVLNQDRQRQQLKPEGINTVYLVCRHLEMGMKRGFETDCGPEGMFLRRSEGAGCEKLDGVCGEVGGSFWTRLNAVCGEVGCPLWA